MLFANSRRNTRQNESGYAHCKSILSELTVFCSSLCGGVPSHQPIGSHRTRIPKVLVRLACGLEVLVRGGGFVLTKAFARGSYAHGRLRSRLLLIRPGSCTAASQ